MIEEIQRDVESLDTLQARLRRVSYEEPVLTLEGGGWSFSTTSAWRVLRQGVLAFGWSRPDAGRLLDSLLGIALIGVEGQALHAAVDPVLKFADGSLLEVFSDEAVDPWSIHLSNIVYVGSPSDPRWIS